MFDSSIFKAYDVRGVYPVQLNERVVFDIIQAYSVFVKPKMVALGRDVRLSSPALAASARDSFRAAGVDVIDIGVIGADMLYFAAWNLPVDGGIYVSASHNPAEWNGLKFSRKGAVPISSQSGLKDIAALARRGVRVHSRRKGALAHKNILDSYVRFALSFVKSQSLTSKKIVANANFGTALKIWERIVKKGDLPVKTVSLNGEPDGSFPKGAPNPLLAENRGEISALVKKEKADLGVAWDADADRCFFIDEKGRFIEGYFVTALLAQEMLRAHPGGKIIIDPRLVWAAAEAVAKAGGFPVISPAGATLIAERMEKEKAIFGGEMSSHFYFHQNANRDNGMIPLLLMLQMMSVQKKKLSELVAPFMKKYFISGEINFQVSDAPWLLQTVEKMHMRGRREHIDGLSVEYADWRFNIRASNTEPLVRLNIEARSRDLMMQKTRELTRFIKRFKLSLDKI